MATIQHSSDVKYCLPLSPEVHSHISYPTKQMSWFWVQKVWLPHPWHYLKAKLKMFLTLQLILLCKIKAGWLTVQKCDPLGNRLLLDSIHSHPTYWVPCKYGAWGSLKQNEVTLKIYFHGSSVLWGNIF